MTETDQQLILEMLDSAYWSRPQLRKVQAVLAIAQGERQVKVAERLNYSPASIRSVCRRYEREGLAGLLMQRPRTGRPQSRTRRASEPGM